MVPVGSGAREDPTHGVPGGGRSVAGCGRQSWRGVGVGGVGRGGRAGGREKPRQALRARRLWHAGANSATGSGANVERGGGGGAGQVRVVVVAGRGWGGVGGVGGPELGSGGRWRVVVVGASCYRCPTTRK